MEWIRKPLGAALLRVVEYLHPESEISEPELFAG